MERSAVAYRVRDKLIIGSVVRTSTGLGLEVDPVALDIASPDDLVSKAIDQALARSSQVVPHPTQAQWKGFFKPFEVAAGVGSYKAFMSDAQSVSLSANEAELELTPQRNLGTKEGFAPVNPEAVVLPVNDLDRAAATLKALLTRKRS